MGRKEKNISKFHQIPTIRVTRATFFDRRKKHRCTLQFSTAVYRCTWTTVSGTMLAGICCLFRRFDFVNSYLAFILRHCFSQGCSYPVPAVHVKPKPLSFGLVIKRFAVRVKCRLFCKRAYFKNRPEAAPKRLRFRHFFQKKTSRAFMLPKIGIFSRVAEQWILPNPNNSNSTNPLTEK